MVYLTLEEAADLANVKPTQLKLWLAGKQFETKAVSFSNGQVTYYFCEEDIQRLIEFVKSNGESRPESMRPPTPFIDDGKQENFTVAQIASLWRLSTDTIQRLFEDEPGVVVLGNKNPRGKRRRVTLRIPRAVMERVKRKRSNV